MFYKVSTLNPEAMLIPYSRVLTMRILDCELTTFADTALQGMGREKRSWLFVNLVIRNMARHDLGYHCTAAEIAPKQKTHSVMGNDFYL